MVLSDPAILLVLPNTHDRPWWICLGPETCQRPLPVANVVNTLNPLLFGHPLWTHLSTSGSPTGKAGLRIGRREVGIRLSGSGRRRRIRPLRGEGARACGAPRLVDPGTGRGPG